MNIIDSEINRHVAYLVDESSKNLFVVDALAPYLDPGARGTKAQLRQNRHKRAATCCLNRNKTLLLEDDRLLPDPPALWGEP
jgi:hypothetical protein